MTDYFPGPGPGAGPGPLEPEETPEPAEATAPTQAGLPDDAMSPEPEPPYAGSQEEPPVQAYDEESPAPAHAHADTPSAPGAKPIAPKEYYSISEVCDLVGLKPHVLRYWESQFPVLNPSKNRSGNRVYQRKEIKLILLVQHLLYKEKYTIEGARQRLDQLRRGGKTGELAQATSQALDSEMRQLLRDELQQLLEVLAPGTAAPSAPREGRRAGHAAEAPTSAHPGRAAE